MVGRGIAAGTALAWRRFLIVSVALIAGCVAVSLLWIDRPYHALWLLLPGVSLMIVVFPWSTALTRRRFGVRLMQLDLMALAAGIAWFPGWWGLGFLVTGFVVVVLSVYAMVVYTVRVDFFNAAP